MHQAQAARRGTEKLEGIEIARLLGWVGKRKAIAGLAIGATQEIWVGRYPTKEGTMPAVPRLARRGGAALLLSLPANGV